MHPHTHSYSDTYKHHKTFKFTQFHMHAHTELQTHTHTHTHTRTHTHTHKHTKPTQVNTSLSFSAATVNVKQQNLHMANENIGSCVILYCTSYQLLYQVFLLHMTFSKKIVISHINENYLLGRSPLQKSIICWKIVTPNVKL